MKCLYAVAGGVAEAAQLLLGSLGEAKSPS
jgi:hypothetical protein